MAIVRLKEDNSFERYDEPRLHMATLMRAHLIEFDLPPRIVFKLVDHGIKRLGDLVQSNPHELMKIPSIGVSAVKTLEEFLQYHLLHFGMKI